MNIWTYWEGPIQQYIQECLDSIGRVCSDCDVHILTPETIGEFIPGDLLHPRWRSLGVVMRSDCIRAAVTAIHGGLWIDADTLMLTSPRPLLEPHVDVDFAFVQWNESSVRICAAFFYAKKGSYLTTSWVKKINDVLARKKELHWLDVSQNVLVPLVQGSKARQVQIPLPLVMPVELPTERLDGGIERFFKVGDPKDLIPARSVAVMFAHSWICYNHPEFAYSKEPWKGDTVIARLFANNRKSV